MAQRQVLVYGGNGALGRAVVSAFAGAKWAVTSVDLTENPAAARNVAVPAGASWEDAATQVVNSVSQFASEGFFAAIICVAGGWAGGNAAAADFIKNSDLMWKQSVQSSAIAAHLASKFLAPNGFVLMTGAVAAQKGTPGMIGYGMAKAAVHQLVKSLAAEGSGLPAGAHTVAILPITLDTPANRQWAAADTDFGTWTPVDALANQVLAWADAPATAVNGALYEVVTKGGKTTFTPAA